MKKIGIFGFIILGFCFTSCGGGGSTPYTPPTTKYEKVKTAFNGVENSFKNASSGSSRETNRKFLKDGTESILESLFSLYVEEDKQGTSIEELSYTEPPMIQFQCLKYAYEKIGSEYSFDTKYYDDITGKVYIDFDTAMEAEHIEEYEYDYDFLLSLAINIDDNDLITADISFGITLSKEEETYHTDWYVNMVLDYNMDKENPTYTLSMLTNNDERDLPYYSRCVYEYDYVEVVDSSIKEWRKFDLEAPIELIVDDAHPTITPYIESGMDYKVGAFSWFKNNTYYKANNIKQEDNRKEVVANKFYLLGLNSTDIDPINFKNKVGVRNSVISNMYQEFCNIFRKDIIYSLVTSDGDRHDDTPSSIKIVDINNNERELTSKDELYIANKDASIRDLIEDKEIYSESSIFIPKFLILNKEGEILKEATLEEVEFGILYNEEVIPIEDNSTLLIDIASRYNTPIFTLVICLVNKGSIVSSYDMNINVTPFASLIYEWPLDTLTSKGLGDILPNFTSRSYMAKVVDVETYTDPNKVQITLEGLDDTDVENYFKVLEKEGYPCIDKNNNYAIKDLENNKVYLIRFEGYPYSGRLIIEENDNYRCSYTDVDKELSILLGQDILLPEGLIFSYPYDFQEQYNIYDYYGVSEDIFSQYISRLTSNGWKENEDPYSSYKYYLDYNNVRYTLSIENNDEYSIRIMYSSTSIPSDKYESADIILKQGSIPMENDNDGNLSHVLYLEVGTNFYISARKNGQETILDYSSLQHNETSDKYLTIGDGNNIQVNGEAILRITLIEDKIVVTLESGGEDPTPSIQDHNYTMVGEFNSWATNTGIDLEFDANNNYFYISYYEFEDGKGFVILQDYGWSTYYGYSNLAGDYSEYLIEGETNGIVPIKNFSATVMFDGSNITLTNIVDLK